MKKKITQKRVSVLTLVVVQFLSLAFFWPNNPPSVDPPTISRPPQFACDFSLQASVVNATCFGQSNGSINLTVTGVGAPFTYDWSNDGADVPDNDPEDLSGLPAGSYTVTVTDNLSCSKTLSVQIGQPSNMLINGTATNVSNYGGNDGYIDIAVSGGTSPYMFDWSNDGAENPDNDDEDIFDLIVGNYTVTVTDGNNCSKNASFAVANPLNFDLALRKTLGPVQSLEVLPGDDVTFTITVFNQGQIAAKNILVIDYLPANMTFTASQNPGWNNFGAGPALFISSLAPGSSFSKNIILNVSNTASNGDINNYAEISSADDNDPDTPDLPIDIDSDPNAFQFDDPGGFPGSEADDVITGDGTGVFGSNDPLTDEDDHDGAKVIVSLPVLTLGDKVFNDKDNDGVFNNFDTGITGVILEFYSAGADQLKGTADDQLLDTQTTNLIGGYLFETTTSGYYYVRMADADIPTGYVSSTGEGIYDNDGAGPYEPAIGTDLNIDYEDDGSYQSNGIYSEVIHLDFGTEPDNNDNYTVDFGLYELQTQPKLRLGDIVFYDFDNNGVYNYYDIGVENITVELYDAGADQDQGTIDDSWFASTETDSLGKYIFEDIPEGHYFIVLTNIPGGYFSSTGDGIFDNDGNGFYEPAFGTNDDVNSTDDGTQVDSMIQSGVIELNYGGEPNGNDNYTVDFGIYLPQSQNSVHLGDLVFADIDNDGAFNNNDYGIEDVPVELYDAGFDQIANTPDDIYLQTQLTNGFGDYLFMGMPEGFYFVKLPGVGIPANFISSTGDGPYDTDGSGSYEPATGTNMDIDQTDDGTQIGQAIISGVIELSIGNEPDGNFNFTLDLGLYEPQPLPSANLGNMVFYDFENDGIFNNQDYGIEGVEVEIYNAGLDAIMGTLDDVFLESKLTDSFGQYLFTDLPAGFYYIKLTGVGIPASYISSTGETVLDNDANGPYEPATSPNDNIDGNDDGTQEGNAVVSAVMELTLGDEPDGNTNLSLDFGFYQPQQPAYLGNFVWYDLDHNGQQGPFELGVQNVPVQVFSVGYDGIKGSPDDILTASQVTNSNGIYFFQNLVPGEYYLRINLIVLPTGYHPTDQNIGDDGTDSDADATGTTDVFTLSQGETNVNLDFGIEPETGNIGNFVWQDFNNNGQQDSGEPGVSGIHVYLLDLGSDGVVGNDDHQIADDITDANGEYGFLNLNPNNYYLVFDPTTLPPNFYTTLQNAGLNDAIDSDADAAGVTEPFFLNAAETNSNVDFGIASSNYDLALTKNLSLGQSTQVDIGDEISYTITVKNQGDNPVYEIKVIDHLPDGLLLSSGNLGWTSVDIHTVEYTIAGPIMPGDSVDIVILTRVQYASSGASLVNMAEVGSVQDINGDVVTDADSTPDNSTPGEDDTDESGITLIPHDPTGWIYCNKTGKIITGGTISVTGPNGIPNSQVAIINDGSDGYYEFYTDGTPGIYSISYTHPNGYPLSTSCSAGPGPFDPTGLPNPIVFGVDTLNALYLFDTTCASNPYYLSFNIEPGDPNIHLNNLPVSCILISAYVLDDSNLNDAVDAGDAPQIGTTVYLYSCEDLTIPIDSTLTDGNGRYIFEGLEEGDYAVGASLSANERLISTGNINQTGLSDCISLTWGQCDTTLTFDFYPCPSLNLGPDIDHCSSANSSQLNANLSDGMGSFTWSPAAGLSNSTIENPSVMPLISTTYIISFQDGFGCETTDTIAVNVGTSTPYLANMPATDLVAQCAPLPVENPIFADDCDPSLAITTDTITTLQACGFIREITWTSTNDEGNFTTFTQTLTATDTEPPSMTANHAFFGPIMDGDTIFADCSMIPSLDSIGFAAFDNCSATTVTFIENVIDGNCPIDGFYQFRHCGWTATDACGNVDSLFFFVVLYDNNPPVLTPAPADVTVNCAAIPPAAVLSATDNCGTPVVTMVETSTTDADGCTTQILRTWTAEDDCGNTASVSQTITVFDNTAPTLVGVPADLTVNCSASIPAPPAVSAADDCDANVSVSIIEAVTAGDPATGCYTLTRNWLATDNCGNTGLASQTITIIDNTPPVLNGVPNDTTYNCTVAVPFGAIVTATDVCDADVPVIFSETINGNSATGCFSMTRTWTATDDCGNMVSDSQTIIVNDNTAPTLNGVPANLTISCEMTVPTPATVAASDACDANIPVDYDQNTNGDPATGCYVLTRIWSATDDCGNTAIASQTITVEDDAAPTLSEQPADLALTCLSQVPAPPTITATDNCDADAPVIFFETPVGNPGCNYQILRTWAAADDCGNVAAHMQTITVNDDVPPVLGAIPANLNLNCSDPIPAPPTITATDNCDNNVDVVLETTYFGDPSGGCYILTRTWTATDDCGNRDTAAQQILIRDTEAPTLVGLPANGVVSCDNLPGSNVTATDNCDANVTITISDHIQSSPLGCVSQVVRTWTATDDCGNTRIASRTFNITNTDAPIITVTAPGFLGLQDGDVLTAECQELVGLNASAAVASADCCGAATLSFHESVTAYNCQSAGLIAVMHCGWIATDCCGNTDSLFFTVNLIDNTAPQLIGIPADTILPVGSMLPPPPVVFTSDNCDNSVPISYNSTTTGPVDNQITIRTWSASDDCGNIAFASQTIFITNDNIAPILANVPDDVIIEGPIADLPDFYGVTATDNLDTDPEITFEEERSVGTCCYIITRRWTATDDFGNSSTATQTITVTDSQAPIIIGVVADVTQACSFGAVPIPLLTATDNCASIVNLNFSQDTTIQSCGFHVIRTWAFSDECGNTAIAQQNILFEDNVPPVFDPATTIAKSFFASQNASPAGGVSLAVGDKILPNETWSIGNQTMPSLLGIASDNCTSPNEIGFQVSHILETSTDCEKSYSVSFQVLDACDNAASNEFVVNVSFKDDTAPSFLNLPQNMTVNCGNLPAPANLTATDNSGAVGISFEEVGVPGCPLVLTRTWTATDACGNSTIAQQKISVVDTEAPSLLNVPVSTLASCGNTPPVPSNVVASDNCAGNLPVNFTETFTGNLDCQHTITRTWSATDACGNSAIKQQYIWVADQMAPTISTLPEVELTVSCEAPMPPAPNLAVSDNCDDSPTVELVETILPGNSDCAYSLLRKWTVTDNCGNASSVQQIIHVLDNTLPTLVGIPADITVTCGNVPAATTVTASDNCDTDVELLFKETPVTIGSGCPLTLERSWIAIDNCGNQAEATQRITVVDNEPPVLSMAPADQTVSCGADVPPAVVLTATDNCSLTVPVAVQEAVIGSGCNRKIQRTWTASDACGNVAMATQAISIEDTEAPVIAGIPSNLTLNCGDQIPTALNVTASDNCTANVSIVLDEKTTATACGHDILRTWTATDECGNLSTATQLISFTDHEAPTVIEPIDLTVDCGELPAPTAPVFSDNCDQHLMVQYAEIKTQVACGQNVLRTWTATDDCGNTRVVDQIIHVLDQTPPILIFENPMLVGLSDGDTLDLECTTGLIFNQNDVSALDACSNVGVQFSMTAFNFGNCTTDGYLVAAKFKWLATDACGNASQLTLNVRLRDNQAPVLSALPDLVVSCGEAAPDFIAPAVEDDCGEVALSFTTQNFSTSFGHNLVGTWTAMDACGNSASTTQTMHVYNIGAAQLVGIPADLTVELASGETVPAPAAVLAQDNCSGDALSLIFEEETTQNGPCNSTIERRWSAVGVNGVTVTQTQTITVLDTVQFTAGMTVDSCHSSNGSLILMPATLDFAWSNQTGESGTGAVLIGLAAGDYTVSATNSNGCSTTATVAVDAACNCSPAVVKEVRKNVTKCGDEMGKAVIVLVGQNVMDFEYTWSPDLGTPSNSGHARTHLPAGHYEVTISMDNLASCIATTSVDIEDDCPDCGQIFGEAPSALTGPQGPREVCLPVPFGLISNYEIKVDGQVFMGPLEPCEPHSAVVYQYGSLLSTGKYSAEWQHGGIIFHTMVSNASELVNAMNAVDPLGHWFADATQKELLSANVNGNYGSLKLRPNSSGTKTSLSLQTTTTNTGTLITLPSGKHLVNVTNLATGCTDELPVSVQDDTESVRIAKPEMGVTEIEPVILVYNVFTPNGDGDNDYFKIVGLEAYPQHALKVYDVWGRLVFRTGHYESNWGGSWSQNNLPNGNYFYLLEDGKGKSYSGTVQILR